MAFDQRVFRLVARGPGRDGIQGRVFDLGTTDDLATITTAGYLDDYADLYVPYQNRQIQSGDFIQGNYGITVDADGNKTGDGLWSWFTVSYDLGNNTYTLTEISPGGAGVTSVFTRTGDVVAVAGDYTAAEVTNAPAGGISSTNVQDALNSLDTEKAPLDSPEFATKVVFGSGTLLEVTGAPNSIMDTVTLVGGTVTVTTTAIKTGSRVFLTRVGANASTAVGCLSMGAIVDGTSFVINALNPTDSTLQANDVSTVAYLIVTDV